MKINRKDLKVEEDKESQFCGAINWQTLWLRSKLWPLTQKCIGPLREC